MANKPHDGQYDAAVIAAIDKYWREHYCSPSIRDVMQMTGVKSTSHMLYILDKLGGQGKILQPKRGVTPVWVAEAIERVKV